MPLTETISHPDGGQSNESARHQERRTRSIQNGANESSEWPLLDPVKLLEASSRLCYPEVCLLVITGERNERTRFMSRLFASEQQLSLRKVAERLQGLVPADEFVGASRRLLMKAVARHLANGRSIIVDGEGLSTAERMEMVAAATRSKCSSHLIALGAERDQDGNGARSRATSADAGTPGPQPSAHGVDSEGFGTVLILATADINSVVAVDFSS